MKRIFASIMAGLIILGAPGVVLAQYIEEIATLESIYETRARTVLNTVLRPSEYTIVVSAQMDRDEDRLKQYREQMELATLPGLPLSPDPTMTPATNELHSMKSSVNVTLILRDDLPQEKEAVIKSLLSSKLHLDESNGDSLTIQRTRFPEDPKPAPKEQEVLPEFGWRTWALIALVAFMLTAGLIYWASRKGKDQTIENTNNEKSKHERYRPEEDVAEEPRPTAETGGAALLAALPEDEKEELRIEELKDRLLLILTQYPYVSNKAVTHLVESEAKNDVLMVFEDLGWDVSKKLFSSLSPRVWGRLGAQVKDNPIKPDRKALKNAYEIFYKAVVARFLETGAREDSENPFAFIESLAPTERETLLMDENVTSFAVLSLYLQPETMADLLSRAKTDLQTGLPAEVARLESLPDSVVKTLVAGLQDKLVRLRASPIHRAEGPAIAARILRSFPAQREEELFHQLVSNNPHEAAKIRRSIVLFTDLPYYPKDILVSCLNLLEVEDLVKALKGVPNEVSQAVLSLLPPRRAQIIDRDLSNASLVVFPRDAADARRQICLKIETLLRARGMSPEEVWDDIERQSGGSHLRAA